MSNHFVAINRGKEGFKASDFTTGSSSSSGSDIELRVADGANLTRFDVYKALEAFRRFFESTTTTNFPVL